MGKWQPPPQEAYFSGYFMEYKHFQELVLALPTRLGASLKTHPGQRSLGFYLTVYDSWKWTIPDAERHIAPRVRAIQTGQDADKLAPNDKVVFFSTRWVHAPDNSAMSDHPGMMIEGAEDQARRDESIGLIERLSKFSVDKTALHFDCVKDVHPYHDPLGGV